MAHLGPKTESATQDAVRVFLLSDDRLLREILPSAFRRQPGILLVGAHTSSGNAVAEIIESACDVLLVDSSNEVSSFETQRVLENLKNMHEQLKLVTVCMDAGTLDLISSIHLACTERQPGIESAQQTVRS